MRSRLDGAQRSHWLIVLILRDIIVLKCLILDLSYDNNSIFNRLFSFVGGFGGLDRYV